MPPGDLSRSEIIEAIQRCTNELGRVPGRNKFELLTGIRESAWSGRYWARWSDAVGEAGLAPNSLQSAIPEEVLLRRLAGTVRDLGKWPTEPELRLRRRSDPTFPSSNTFARLGGRAERIERLRSFCAEQGDWADVVEICDGIVPYLPTGKRTSEESGPPVGVDGYVYLLRSGKHYKIGRSNDQARRLYEINLQLPERAELIHSVATDDPVGIEAYWHQRFAAKRLNGEWFALVQADVAAFRRRKSFM